MFLENTRVSPKTMGCNDFLFFPFQRIFECLKVQSCCCLDDFFIRFGWQTSILIILGRGMSDFFSDKTYLLVDTNIQTEHDQHVFPFCSPFSFRHENLFFESVNHINWPINQTISPKRTEKIRCNINDFQIELSEYLTNFHFNYHRFFCQSFIRCFRHSKVSRFHKLNSPRCQRSGEVRWDPFIHPMEKLEWFDDDETFRVDFFKGKSKGGERNGCFKKLSPQKRFLYA